MADDNLFKTPTEDPTLLAARKALEAREAGRGHSRRIGGSSVGHECTRRGWYSFRWTSPTVIGSSGLLAINDGHRGEIVLADLLRAVEGVELWTEDPEKPGEQISFELVNGHFVGKLDGIILGLLQAPKTPHVWEAKVVNLKKFDKLRKDIEKFGEKNALEQWDAVYFAQAQMYMMGMKIDRHYLTVASPGVRDIISVRTEYQKNRAEMYEGRAQTIAYSSGIPSRISNDPAFYGCKFCDHSDVCHRRETPLINCRTCDHARALPDGIWHCNYHDYVLSVEDQQVACKHHRFHPEFHVANDGDKTHLLEHPEIPF